MSYCGNKETEKNCWQNWKNTVFALPLFY